MAAEATICSSTVPILSGDREALTMEERQDSLHKALQWVRDELSSLKSQDQSLMRQFSSLRSKINLLKDELPASVDRNSTISFTSPKSLNDEDVFFASDESRLRINSDTSFRTKTYSSGSDEEKL